MTSRVSRLVPQGVATDQLSYLYPNSNKNLIKLKHIGIKFLVVKEMVPSEQFFIEHKGIHSMVVNRLTKEATPRYFINALFGWMFYRLKIF